MRGVRQAGFGNERGSVLVITLLIMFAVGVMGATLAMLSSMDLKISGNQRVTTQALDVSEAGLNEAIHRLALANPTNATVGGWTGNIAIGDPPPYDPNWEARLYLTDPGSAPSASASIVPTGTIQDPNGTYLQYSRATGTDDLLTIRHKWTDRNGDNAKDANEVVVDPGQAHHLFLRAVEPGRTADQERKARLCEAKDNRDSETSAGACSSSPSSSCSR